MIDVDQITKKSKLAKEMVKLGIVKNYEEAARKIDDESLVRTYDDHVFKRVEPAEHEQMKTREQSSQNQGQNPMMQERTFLKIGEQPMASPISKTPESQHSCLAPEQEIH